MNKGLKICKALQVFGFLMAIAFAVIPSGASALTVNEVVKDLACPCECPLVLEESMSASPKNPPTIHIIHA